MMSETGPKRDNIDAIDLGDDFTIDKRTDRDFGGTWICGRLNGYRFEALVFPEHAANPEWELGDSRISKLWLQRLVDKHMVYNWDRGMDVPAADDEVGAVVDFLAAGLTEFALQE